MDLAISTKTFDCTIDDGLAHIVLNQPDRGNPIDGEFCREFNLCIAEISERTDVRSVLLSARGRLFSVGGDLVSLVKQGDALPRTIKAWTADLHAAIARMVRMRAPVVASVSGNVAGGSVSLMAAADLVAWSSRNRRGSRRLLRRSGSVRTVDRPPRSRAASALRAPDVFSCSARRWMPRRPCRLDWSTSWSRTVRCKARRNEWRGNWLRVPPRRMARSSACFPRRLTDRWRASWRRRRRRLPQLRERPMHAKVSRRLSKNGSRYLPGDDPASCDNLVVGIS